MLVTDADTAGLRARKARETRRALEAATLALVMEQGFENTTVEQIADRAFVSPRTFFNYFSSKEDAVLGNPIGASGDELLIGFPRRPGPEGVYADLRGFIIRFFEENVLADDLLEKRMAVLAMVPELQRRHMSLLTVVLDRLTLLTARLLALEETPGSAATDRGEPQPQPEPSKDQLAEAHMLLLVSAAALNYAHRSRSAQGATAGQAASIVDAFDLLERTLARHLVRGAPPTAQDTSSRRPGIRPDGTRK